MHDADDAQEARIQIEAQALGHELAKHPISRRFPEKTVLSVLVKGDDTLHVLTCDSLIDRNAQLRARGIDPSRDRHATAFFSQTEEKFIVIANDQTMADALRVKLWLV